MDLAVSSNIEPPPLLFGARPTTPSPNSHHQQSLNSQPLSSSQSPSPGNAPPPATEMDLSTSTTLPQPEGQNHDISDSQMENTDDIPNGHLVEPSVTEGAEAEDNPRQQDEGPEAMDTTPDSQQEPSSNGLAIPEVDTEAPIPTPTNELNEGDQEPLEASAGGNAGDTAEPVAEDTRDGVNGGNVENGSTTTPPPPPIDPVEADQPPPPPAPVADVEQPQADTSANQRDISESDSSSDDEEEPRQIRWEEDLSTPDEEELKEIEEKGPEISALDYDHWQTKFFTDLDDPEYVPDEVARIDWTVTNVHGSLENPNKETVMRSPKVRIGGLDWNIKYYPRGNDTEQLSIYIECAKPKPEQEGTVEAVADEEKQDPNAASTEIAPTVSEPNAAPPAQNTTEPSAEQSTTHPNPADSEEGDDAATEPKEEPDYTWGTAAQFGVVIYNPNEPRVKYSHGNHHRFCAKSPDWGWTRFHGPHAQIHQRFRGERQALLRNDTLAFSAYVRIIKDETGALWEAGHISDWDSLVKTGIRAIGSSNSRLNPLVTGLQAWLLFTPFRELVCATTVPDPIKEPRSTPKPVITALQKLVYSIQDRKEPTNSSVSLDGLVEAFQWYGVKFSSDDVVWSWEQLRKFMEDELRGTNMERKIGILFDGLLKTPTNQDSEHVSTNFETPISSLSAGKAPSFRVPVQDVSNVQAAVARSLNRGDPTLKAEIAHPPIFLQIELDRQLFDTTDRKWKKLVNKVDLDEEIDLRPWTPNINEESRYVLYGYIVHSYDLHSGYYYSVVRPGGPGTRWLRCKDHNSHSHIKCLTRKQAIARHCGVASSKKTDGRESVAYIAMYVRSDIAKDALKGIPEPWQAPQWIKEAADPNSPKEASKGASKEVSPDEQSGKGADELQLLVYDSNVFKGRVGEGLIDFDDPDLDANHVHELTVSAKSKLGTVIDELNAQVPSLRSNDSDAWVWVMDCDEQATFRHPYLVAGNQESWTFEKLREEHPACRIWLHVLTPADVRFTAVSKVPPPPIVPDNPPPAAEDPRPSSSSDTDASTPTPQIENVVEADQAENPIANQPAEANFEAEGGNPIEASSSEDTPMVEASDNVPTPGVEEVDTDSVAPQPSSTEVPTPSLHVDIEVPAATDEPVAPHPDIVDRAVEVVPASQNEALEVVQSPPPSDPSAITDQAMVGGEVAPQVARNPEEDDVEMEDPRDDVEMISESIIESESRPTATEPTADANSTPPLPHIDDIVYFFLKRFDPKEQSLKAVGSFFALKKEDIGVCTRRLLGLPEDKAITLWWENHGAEVLPLTLPRKFSQVVERHGHMIIVQETLSDAEALAIEEKAGYPTAKEYMSKLIFERSAPGTIHGHKTCTYFSEPYQSGSFLNGSFHGPGTTTKLNGQTYTGNFMASYMHGHGTMTYQNKDIYVGEFFKNEMHGQGKMIYFKTGNIYEGGWRHGRRHGKGKMEYMVADEELLLCQICYESEQDALFYDCGHVCACVECARQVETCPVCRRSVVAVVKIYRT